MIVLSNLPANYMPDVRPQQRLPKLLDAQRKDGETVDEALKSGRFIEVHKRNDLQVPNHLQNAYSSLHGYYHGDRKDFGRHTVLLPVGTCHYGTTTVEMHIGFDARPGCTIHVRTLIDLHGIVSEALEVGQPILLSAHFLAGICMASNSILWPTFGFRQYLYCLSVLLLCVV
jgi:hypothetical protein